jgi:hypothetical protein
MGGKNACVVLTTARFDKQFMKWLVGGYLSAGQLHRDRARARASQRSPTASSPHSRRGDCGRKP